MHVMQHKGIVIVRLNRSSKFLVRKECRKFTDIHTILYGRWIIHLGTGIEIH
jgi:hypothetical protein